jgi:hypothetical protein
MSFENETAQCQSCGSAFFREPGQYWKRSCLECFIAAKNSTKSTQGSVGRKSYIPAKGIEPEMLRRLIYLCHPDKHGNSQASVLATTWLLKQKEIQ